MHRVLRTAPCGVDPQQTGSPSGLPRYNAGIVRQTSTAWIEWRQGLLACLLMWMLPACGVTDTSEPDALQSISLAGGGAYEIAISACDEGQCPIEVRLVRADQTLARAALDWPASTREVYRSEITRVLGIGDPFEPPQAEALVAGEETSSVSVLARPVRLTPEVTALLVDQAVGFDHVKRRHYVFLAREGALQRIWTGREGQGPTYTTIAIRAVAPDRDEMLYFDQLDLRGEPTFDELTVSKLAWDAGSNALRSEPAQGLRAVVIGPYDDPLSARRELEQDTLCLDGFLVLPADRFLAASGAVLAAVTATESVALAVQQRLASCASQLQAQLVEIR